MQIEDVKARYAYDPETGIFTYRVSTGRRKAGAVAGYIKGDGYRLIRLYGQWIYAHRLAWFYCTGSVPVQEIDHINHNRDDNRIANLRQVTRHQNMANMKVMKGWHYHKSDQKWQAMIRVNKRRIYLGRFDSEREAKQAYLQARAQYHQPPKQAQEPLL